MIKFDIDTKALLDVLPEKQRKATRSLANAMTKTVGQAREKTIDIMPQVFDRPTPYTLHGLFVRPATYDRLEARVDFKSNMYKGTPAEKYLGPEVFGGTRVLKRFERALAAKGILPPGMAVVPGRAIKLDAFGNISARDIVQVMRFLQAFAEQGYRTNYNARSMARIKRGTRTKYGLEFVVIRPGEKPASGGKQMKPGIWRRAATGFGKSLDPWMMFVPMPRYQPLLPLQRIADDATRESLQYEFDKAFGS